MVLVCVVCRLPPRLEDLTNKPPVSRQSCSLAIKAEGFARRLTELAAAGLVGGSLSAANGQSSHDCRIGLLVPRCAIPIEQLLNVAGVTLPTGLGVGWVTYSHPGGQDVVRSLLVCVDLVLEEEEKE